MDSAAIQRLILEVRDAIMVLNQRGVVVTPSQADERARNIVERMGVVKIKCWWEGVGYVSCDPDTDYRMYSAGYREGQRLAGVGPLASHTDRMVTKDARLISLGANAYAHGFEDGWNGSVPDWTPLLLSDLDNHFLGARP